MEANIRKLVIAPRLASKALALVLPLLSYSATFVIGGHWLWHRPSLSAIVNGALILLFAICARILAMGLTSRKTRIAASVGFGVLLSFIVQWSIFVDVAKFLFLSPDQQVAFVTSHNAGPVMLLVVLQLYFTIPVVSLSALLGLIPESLPASRPN